MLNCKVCGSTIQVVENNSMTISNVPDSTFDFSDKTVDLNIIKCFHCGAVQLYDTPLSQNYREVYRSIESSPVHREKKKQQLKEFIAKYELHDKKSIEVGCGNGQFLDIFRELNISCDGVEAGKENRSAAKALGYSVPYSYILEVDKYYDCFFTFYYLEHLPEPNTFVSNLYRILKPGGIGLIEVPDYSAIEKNSVWLEFTKDHRIYYKKNTLCYLLTKFGFDIESVTENADDLCLSVVVRKPETICSTFDPFSNMKDKIKKDEEKFKTLVDTLGGNFSVFGAGHYAQLLINRLYAKHGIQPKHIFDSNKKKCGNKLCGVTIEHKDNLTSMTDCGTIVIICGIYNSEVEKMFQSMNIPWEFISWN